MKGCFTYPTSVETAAVKPQAWLLLIPDESLKNSSVTPRLAASIPDEGLKNCSDYAGAPTGPEGGHQAALGVLHQGGGHGAQGLLAGSDEVGGAGGQAIRIRLLGRAEIVHLVVQQQP